MADFKNRWCGSSDHMLSRRMFFGTGGAVAGGAMGLDLLGSSAIASQMKRSEKRVLMIFLNGGASQFETWDPKPGTETGGPFISIPTSITGYRISELMPEMAKRLHQHTCVIRSLDTYNGDHVDAPLYGGKPNRGVIRYPDVGSMVASELGDPGSPLPNHVTFTNYLGQSYETNAGFLGAQWNPINIKPESIPAKAPFSIADSKLRLAPNGITSPDWMTLDQHIERAGLRTQLSQSFVAGRQRDAVLASYETAHARVHGLMDSRKLFSLEGEPTSVLDQYGPTPFGQHAIVARRLIEAGVPFVRINRGWWDHHGQNFEFHQEMVPELDWVLAALLDDLGDRGLLEHTLVVTFSEMGRTPYVNNNQGRDHFRRMSVTLSGCGIKPGIVYGKTNETGHEIVEDEVNLQQFLATIFRAVGIDHQKENHALDGRPVPLTDYGTDPVDDILA